MEQTAPSCDPALLSCITPAEILAVLPFVAAALLALGIWGLIRHEQRKHAGLMPKRGTAPGEGDTVTTINMSSQGRGRDHQVTIRHTKDPQKHARAMMPAKAPKRTNR